MKILKTIFSKTVVISGLIVFVFLIIGFVALTSLFISRSEIIPKVESEITIIAYSNLIPEITKLITLTSSPDSNNTIISKGFNVSVNGTEGEGLRLHQSAGQESPTVHLANDGDLFIITDGPIITGGYVWWQIRSSTIETNIGWVVQDFLQVNILPQ